MKSQNQWELDQILKQWQWIVGGEVRQFRYNEKSFQLQFLVEEALVWMTFSLKPGSPYLFFSKQRLRLVRNLKKPLSLFFKTYFLERRLISLHREEELGRVVVLSFEEGAQLRLHVIPGRVNLEVSANGKVVFATKPQDLDPVVVGDVASPQSLRGSDFFASHWEQQEEAKSDRPQGGLDKQIKKKESGLQKMHEKLQELEKDLWGQWGRWLQQSRSLDEVPQIYEKFVDLSLDLNGNIEKAFQQSKKNRMKKEGTQNRIEVLKQEIEQLRQGEVGRPSKKQAQPKESLLYTAGTKGRTHVLSEGRLYIGRSSTENLKLLRKAKPWYLWLHIKDYPGAYGIIEKNKGASLSEKSLQEAALAVVQQSLPKGALGVFEVLYSECRYVRPIKGAKSGQVTYSHEKLLRIRVDQ